MSWTKPARRPINTSGRKLQAGINRMVESHTKDKLAKEEKQRKDAQTAEELLKKRTSAVDATLSKGFDTLESDIGSFGKFMKPEHRNQMQDELMNVLTTMRDEEADWLRNNPEATELERKQHLNKSLTSLNQLHNDLMYLTAAQQEYLKARDIPLGEEGALIPNYNPELIKFFEGMDAGNMPVHLTRDDSDSWRISMVNEDELGNALENAGPNDVIDFTSIDITGFAKGAAEGDGFFKTIEAPDYTELTEQIHSQIDKGNTDFGTKGKEGEYIIDKEAVEEFYSNGGGANIMTSISQDPDSFGNWLYYGEDIYGDDGSISRSNTINNFDPIQYKNTYLTGFLDSLPDNKPKPKSKYKVSPTTPKTPPPGKDSLGLGIDTKTNNDPVEEEIKEEEIIDLKNPMGISFDDFDTIKDEDGVIKLLKQFSDDFEFGSTTGGKDEIYIKSKQNPSIIKTFDLNTEYNKNEGKVPLKPMYGKFVYESINKFIRENLPKK